MYGSVVYAGVVHAGSPLYPVYFTVSESTSPAILQSLHARVANADASGAISEGQSLVALIVSNEIVHPITPASLAAAISQVENGSGIDQNVLRASYISGDVGSATLAETLHALISQAEQLHASELHVLVVGITATENVPFTDTALLHALHSSLDSAAGSDPAVAHGYYTSLDSASGAVSQALAALLTDSEALSYQELTVFTRTLDGIEIFLTGVTLGDVSLTGASSSVSLVSAKGLKKPKLVRALSQVYSDTPIGD